MAPTPCDRLPRGDGGCSVILEGIIGSIAWRFDGAKLDLVWFQCDPYSPLMMGQPVRRKSITSYKAIKATKRISSARALERRRSEINARRRELYKLTHSRA